MKSKRGRRPETFRCDYCHRFIGYIDFEIGRAVRYMSRPDNAFDGECYETYHISCAINHKRKITDENQT